MSYNDYFKNMMDMQQETMKFWQDQVEQLNKMTASGNPFQAFGNNPYQMPDFQNPAMVNPFLNNDTMEKAYQYQVDSQKELADNTQKVMQQWYAMNNKIFQDQLQTAQNPFENMDFYSKMMEGRDNYERLANEYANMMAGITDYVMNPANEMEKLKKQYSGMFAESMLNYMPSPMRDMVARQLKVYESNESIKEELVQPWIDQAKEMQKLLILSASGDGAATEDLLQKWQSTFSQTFGRFLNLPVFSLNKADMQAMMNALDSYIAFLNSFGGFMVAILEEGERTYDSVMKDFQEMVKNNELPTTFNGFYQYWIKANEVSFKKLFGTESFSKMSGQLLQNWVRFKKQYDTVLNNYLKMLPLPSTEDMDSVYQKIDTLKRDVRELKANVKDVSTLEKEVTDLKTTIKTLQTGQNSMKKELTDLKNAIQKLSEGGASQQPAAKK